MREIRMLRTTWRKLETGLRGGVRHRHCESRRQQLPPSAYRNRASRRLYSITTQGPEPCTPPSLCRAHPRETGCLGAPRLPGTRAVTHI